MTVSELIDKLESFRCEHGDLPVVVYHDECYGIDEWEEFRSPELELKYDEEPRHTKEWLKQHKRPGDGKVPEVDIPDGPYLTLMSIDR